MKYKEIGFIATVLSIAEEIVAVTSLVLLQEFLLDLKYIDLKCDFKITEDVCPPSIDFMTIYFQ